MKCMVDVNWLYCIVSFSRVALLYFHFVLLFWFDCSGKEVKVFYILDSANYSLTVEVTVVSKRANKTVYVIL